jgi:hypothetical protein
MKEEDLTAKDAKKRESYEECPLMARMGANSMKGLGIKRTTKDVSTASEEIAFAMIRAIRGRCFSNPSFFALLSVFCG